MTRNSTRAMVTSLLLLAGCGTTEPGDVDLSGTWRANVNSLGVGPITLTLVDRSSELTATGEWVPLEGGTPLTVTGQGLHFGVDINLVLRFTTTTSTNEYTTQGRVEDESSFHLVFPTEENPIRVIFRRQ